MQAAVFLSYRRADTSGHAGRIADDLNRQFGGSTVFHDVDSISAGADFEHALRRAIGEARVCLVLIGDTWLSECLSDGTRRLDNPDDPVRREIELALDEPDLLVLPVLVEGAKMPHADRLPESLQRLARLQAVELSESRWDYDMTQLAEVLRGAGIGPQTVTRLPRWFVPVIAVMALAVVAAAVYCWRQGDTSIDRFTGLWHQPNGAYWSVRERDDGLWIEETHHESGQVWKRGPGQRDGDILTATLALVFDHENFRYLHRLRLAADGQSLIGVVRRSDQQAERSVVMTRTAP